VARIGADYWEDIYFRGCKAYHYLIPGMAIPAYILWPGVNGTESSQRFEIMREGVQEGEARIFLEQAVGRGDLPPELAKKVNQVLFDHNRENLFIPVSLSSRFMDYSAGWQERSRRLFSTAAEVAAVSGLDVNRLKFSATIPARGTRRITLKVRNWTPKPRAWTAVSETPWIMPSKPAGTAEGHEELYVELDATKLKSEAKAQGKLRITDAKTKKVFPIEIGVNVTKVFDFVPPDTDRARQWFKFTFIPHDGMFPMNVAPQKSQTAEIIILNRSGAEISWKASVSKPWINVKPSSGKVLPQSPITLQVTAAAPDKDSAYHEAVLSIAETNGPAKIDIPLAVHVIPPYTKPALPSGEPVALDAKLFKGLCKGYRGSTGVGGTGPGALDGRNKRDLFKDKTFKHWIKGGGPLDAEFNIEGKGYTAFSAHVGFPLKWMGVVGLHFSPGPDDTRLNYEIYVDGKLRTQSDFVGPKDGFRLIVQDGLKDAKKLRLVVRPKNLPGDALHVFWFEPMFYK
jgi:hypothetical protein